MILLVSSFAGATENRPLSTVCDFKDNQGKSFVALSFYPHSDALTTGLVDILVTYNDTILGASNLLSDMKGNLLSDNRLHFHFDSKNADHTWFDLVLSNGDGTASLQLDEFDAQKRIITKCTSK